MDQLVELIQSMSKMEKRQFVLEQKSLSPENHIFTLYKEVVKADAYDENALKKLFKGKTFVKILPTIKNQLYRALLSSMREFHKKSNIDFIIRNELTEIDILIKKKLYTQALKKCNAIKKNIESHERFTYYMEVILKETELKFYTQKNKEFVNQINRSITTARWVGRSYYLYAYQKLMLFRTQSMLWNGKTFDEIKYDPTREKKFLDVRSAYYYNLHHSLLYHVQTKNYQEALKVSDSLIQLMEENPHEFEDNPEQKVDVWYACGMAYLFNGEHEKLDKILSDIEELKTDNRRIAIRKNERLIDLKLQQILVHNKGEEELDTIRDIVEEESKDYSTFYAQKFWDALSTIYMKRNEFRESLKCNYHLLIYKKTRRANHYYIRATLREIYLYYVQGKETIFESRLKSVTRSNMPLTDQEKSLLKNIKNGEKIAAYKAYLMRKKKT
ncbi:MAG: hypothetical protein KDC84_00425 [Crocinitomicaceae bacterium]|nr:hypothetical protein [Crocinitomicaceae bacterium]